MTARYLLAVAAVLASVLAGPLAPAQAQPVTAPAPQAISIPSYFRPGPLWDRMNDAFPTVRQAIINPGNGPGSSPDLDYASQVDESQAAGLRVLGYVHTEYGNRSAATVRDEVDRYYRWYGVDGIFFDEASNECARHGYYLGLYQHVKAHGGKAVVVLNPGTHTNECYMTASDIVVNFEGPRDTYASYVARSWVHNYPATRFWHLIYDTPEDRLLSVIDHSRTQNAGWLYVTPDGDDGNPWDSLPSGSYWATLLAELAPLTRWRAINDATTVTYRTHYNGAWDWLRAYLDTDLDTTTGFGVGGVGADYLIENGTLYRHQGGGWNWAPLQTLATTTTPNSVAWTVNRTTIGETAAAETASVVYQAEKHQEATWTAPEYRHDYSASSGSISRYGADNDPRNVYYEATITAAHAFKHVFIDTDQNTATGYRTQTGGIGADYLIENGTLYRHNGGGWSWTPLGSANLTVSGSLHRWSVARAQLGETKAAGEASSLVFHGSGGTPAEYYTPAYTHRFTSSTATPPDPAATLLAAGDIASCTSPGDEATAAVLDHNSGTVATLGDNVYDSGTATEFSNCYDPSWGRHKARTRPAPGNHDYKTPGAAGYYGYFGPAAGDPAKGYYSYQLGSWHIIVLNSNCSKVGGCGAGSQQEQWLRAELRANPSDCTLAYWHYPRFSSGSDHGSDPAMQPFWQALYDHGADVVLNGHEHHYERFAPQTPSGITDQARGMRQFVVGTGGASSYDFGDPVANSEVRQTDIFGVLKLTLRQAAYDWQFLPEAGKTFTDTGSGVCH